MDVSVVVPVYRNAATVAELAARLRSALAERVCAYEILFVDDACPAGSGDALRALAANDPCVGVISLAENGGQNRAVVVGLAHATGRAVVVLDADLQDPPEAVPSLLDGLGEHAAAVFAGRRGHYESGVRLVTSKVYKRVLRAATGGRLPPDAGLFVAMTSNLAARVVATCGEDPYVLAVMARTGLPMTSVPVERAPRGEGTSSYTGGMRFGTAWKGIRSALGSAGAPVRMPSVRQYAGEPFAARAQGAGGRR